MRKLLASTLPVLFYMADGIAAGSAAATADPAKPETVEATTGTEIAEDDAKERKFFSHANIEAGGFPYIETLMGTYPNLPRFTNFDLENVELKDGFGLMVQPLTKRNAEKGEPMQLTGFIFGMVPEVSAVLDNAKGANFVENALLEVFARKFKTAIANSEPGEPIVLVDTLEGFLEKQTRGEGLGDFQLAATTIVDSLKKAGFKGMDKTILKHCFMSAKFAAAQYTKVPQAIWEKLLDKAKGIVAAKGKSGAIFDSWKSTRAERDFDAGELDLSELGLSDLKEETANA